MMGFGMGFGWIFSIILFALGFWVVVQVLQKKEERPMRDAEDPLQILKKRYARGEISKQEYEQMRNDLQK